MLYFKSHIQLIILNEYTSCEFDISIYVVICTLLKWNVKKDHCKVEQTFVVQVHVHSFHTPVVLVFKKATWYQFCGYFHLAERLLGTLCLMSACLSHFVVVIKATTGDICVPLIFMPPAWKVRRGHLVIGLSFCPFVRNSVPLTNKLQYLKFGWWYSNQT